MVVGWCLKVRTGRLPGCLPFPDGRLLFSVVAGRQQAAAAASAHFGFSLVVFG